jgi:hypothetical protein
MQQHVLPQVFTNDRIKRRSRNRSCHGEITSDLEFYVISENQNFLGDERKWGAERKNRKRSALFNSEDGLKLFCDEEY